MKNIEVIDRVNRAIFAGVKQADLDYEAMSGEWVNERGVESFIAGRVAIRLRRKRSLSIKNMLIEVTVTELIDDYSDGRLTKGRAGTALGRRNRIDIVALDRDDYAIGVVELKRGVYYKGWLRDIVRVARICRRMPKVQFGAFAAFVGEEKGSRDSEIIFSKIDQSAIRLAQETGLQVQTFKRRSRWKSYEEGLFRYTILGCTFAMPDP